MRGSSRIGGLGLSLVLGTLGLGRSAWAGPPADPAQQAAGQRFLEAVGAEDYEAIRGLVDPGLSWDQVHAAAVELHGVLAAHGRAVEPYMVEVSGPARRYSYRLARDVSTPPGLLLYLTFEDDGDARIDGFRWAARPASPGGPVKTSRAEELVVEGAGRWVVDGHERVVRGVSVVRFAQGGMLAVAVEQDYPDGLTQEAALALALPLARYAHAHGYLDRARQVATAAGMPLEAEVIGVALMRPGTARGYRVQVPVAGLAP